MKHIRKIVVGLILLAVQFTSSLFASRVTFQIFYYPIAHVEKEGIKVFAMKEGVALTAGVGVDALCFVRILGYLLILWGLLGLYRYHKRFRIAGYTTIVSLVAYSLLQVLPFGTLSTSLLGLLMILFLVYFIADMILLYSIYLGMRSQVREFEDMEVRHELYFAWELWAFGRVAAKVAAMLNRFLPFTDWLVVLLGITTLTGIFYYIFRLYGYTKKFQLFLEAMK